MSDALGKAADCDVIVTSGGASVGDHDLIRPALENWGADVDFWRVAVRPGKPLLVARRGRTTIAGLPGNPVSSFVTCFLFVLPLLRRLSGASHAIPSPVYIPVNEQLEATGDRTEFRRAKLSSDGVTPILERDSSVLRALAEADALIRSEAGSDAVPAGGLVPVYLLHNAGIA